MGGEGAPSCAQIQKVPGGGGRGVDAKETRPSRAPRILVPAGARPRRLRAGAGAGARRTRAQGPWAACSAQPQSA